ncbi:MAG TPA: discoidin domain-containing protein [Polyangia bacterium]|jgi:hypothetical protein
MQTFIIRSLVAGLALAALPSLAYAAPCGTENLLAGKKPSASQAVKGDLGLVTDGTVGPEGTQWDAPVTVTLENSNSSITYDLGEVRSISAIVMQGDANDTYKVSGSVDGSPASYKQIAELANVVASGHGLRTRATQVPPTEVRYLRVGEANGDNFFSISEFAAFCKAPTPFPPGMKIVDVPPVSTPDSQTAPKPGSDTGRWALLLTAVALALAWLAYKTITRPAAEPTDGADDAAKSASADKAADKPADSPPGDKPAT